MKRILIFDPNISGHHLEYLWHLYAYLQGQGEVEAIFVVHPAFREKNRFFPMPDQKHIRFVCLEESLHRPVDVFWSWKSAYLKCRLLNDCIKRYRPDRTILVTLFAFFPFIPFLSGKGRIRGIVYSIYLRRALPRASRLMHRFFFFQMARKSNLEKVFLLNDPASAARVNALYGSRKFHPLPDPFLAPAQPATRDADDRIAPDALDAGVAKRYIHFGSMSRRKGTLAVLDAFLAYPGPERISLLLLGKVGSEIRDDFYRKTALLQQKRQVELFVRDAFCSYAAIGSVMPCCDYILMPYTHTSQSSGMLGYAAFYNKPVIGPRQGLIGELIARYALGYTLEAVSSVSLGEAILRTAATPTLAIQGDRYLSDNSAETFSKLLVD